MKISATVPTALLPVILLSDAYVTSAGEWDATRLVALAFFLDA
jgi:hypothetical protein